MVELIELAKQGVINPIVSKHYTLDEATGALDDLKDLTTSHCLHAM